MSKLFHPLLALIASATDKELAKYVEYLKHENKILRARLPKQIHTAYEERQTLLKFGKVIGRAIEELVTIVSPATFYRWVRDGDEPSVVAVSSTGSLVEVNQAAICSTSFAPESVKGRSGFCSFDVASPCRTR